jgi:hypothetical protein
MDLDDQRNGIQAALVLCQQLQSLFLILCTSQYRPAQELHREVVSLALRKGLGSLCTRVGRFAGRYRLLKFAKQFDSLQVWRALVRTRRDVLQRFIVLTEGDLRAKLQHLSCKLVAGRERRRVEFKDVLVFILVESVVYVHKLCKVC